MVRMVVMALALSACVASEDSGSEAAPAGAAEMSEAARRLEEIKQGDDWKPAVGGTSVMVLDDGFAIAGFDPVAYFTEGGPVPGTPEWTYEWRDAVWLFSTEHHRDLFASDPEAYAPQYGGWCAYGVSGHKDGPGYGAETRPQDSWSIIDGKLYFNWNPAIADRFRSQYTQLVDDADGYWPDVSADLETGGRVHRQTGLDR